MKKFRKAPSASPQCEPYTKQKKHKLFLGKNEKTRRNIGDWYLFQEEPKILKEIISETA